jgi:Raf kinase inhibitor-like YbhB/YbcL family protein
VNRLARAALLLLAPSLLCACGGEGQSTPKSKEGERVMALRITSPAFQPGQPIPPRFTCKETDLSPALAWSGAPPGTKSFALVCDDPDAPIGTWVHWVIFNLPADSTGLPEGVPTDPALASGATQGKNSWRKVGYGGPCPPPGKAHRYFFRLYALDAALALDSNADQGKVEGAMKGHVLAEGELMGTFKR